MLEVLRLQAKQTEDGLDDELRKEVKELGIDLTALASPSPEIKAQSTHPMTPETSRRSQESVGSRASQSTGFMSTYSDASRDQHHHAARAPYRSSLSFRDYDAFVARGRLDGRNSVSFSPPTTPSQSTLSLGLSNPESSPKKHFRRIRGLSMLRLGRSGSDTSLVETCPYCPQDPQSQRRAVHKLPCGHRLCTQALRATINTAPDNQKDVVPSCCGVPIPGNLVEHVTNQGEQTALMLKLEHHTEAASMDHSTMSEITLPEAMHPLADSTDTSQATMKQPEAPKPQQHLEVTLERPELQRLKQDQAEQLDRFATWTSNRRAALVSQQNVLREQVKAAHDATFEELEDAHNAAMSEAEDNQVKAEADMRDSHKREKRDNATALKHMEAYCAGTYSSGELHNRTVTVQDNAELEKTRRIREQMDARHDSAINVLRGEQSRRMRLRAQRQEREEQDLRRAQRREELELERSFGQEAARLDHEAAEKRQRMQSRWQLQTAIMTKKLAVESDSKGEEQLPSHNWQLGRPIEHATTIGAVEEMRCETAKDGISTGITMRGSSGRVA